METTTIGTITCDQAIDFFPDRVAELLEPEPWASLSRHIEGCEPCHDKLLALETYLHILAFQELLQALRRFGHAIESLHVRKGWPVLLIGAKADVDWVIQQITSAPSGMPAEE